QRHLVTESRSVESSLVCDVQAEPAVFAGKADPGESARVQSLLQFAGTLPGRVVAAIAQGWPGGIDLWHVLGNPRAGARRKGLHRFGHAADPALRTRS